LTDEWNVVQERRGCQPAFQRQKSLEILFNALPPTRRPRCNILRTDALLTQYPEQSMKSRPVALSRSKTGSLFDTVGIDRGGIELLGRQVPDVQPSTQLRYLQDLRTN
jgi:hypothetical protein